MSSYTKSTIGEAKELARESAIRDKERWYITIGDVTNKDGTKKYDLPWVIDAPTFNKPNIRPDLKNNAFCYYTPEGLEVRLDGADNDVVEVALTKEQWALVKTMLDIKDEDDLLTEAESTLKGVLEDV